VIAGRDLPRLHLVTDDAVVRRERFPEMAADLLGAGGAKVALHLRSPAATGRRLFDLVTWLAPLASASGAWLLVNDRVDVALAGGAHGVQLGAQALGIRDARRLLGRDRAIGASVHEPAAAAGAFAAGADFVLAGTLFPSASHPGRRGTGVGWLRQLGPEAGPMIGIGGITPQRVGEVLSAGAHGVAVITAVWDAERPERALLRLLDTLNDARGSE
jgi:thiamine-phosphate diphosphorylase